MARGANGARRVHLINAQRHAIIEEFKRRSSDGEKRCGGMICMGAIWNELSADTIRNCQKHTELLKEHDEAASFTDLTASEIVNVDEERQEMEDALAELVPSRIRMTVGEFLEVGEDENCTDAVYAEDTVASLADDVYKFFGRK